MSVLIKDMVMPKSCQECMAYVCYKQWSGDIGDEFCGLTKNNIPSEGVPNWCPLVELKPHGDLIDRNDLKKEYAMGFDCNNCVSNWKSCQYDAFYAKMDFCLMLDDAPVVIEAEDE